MLYKNFCLKSKQNPNKNLSLPDDVLVPILNVLPIEMRTNIVINKFESVNELIKINFDIFIITGSKLDSSFLDSHFLIPGYIHQGC